LRDKVVSRYLSFCAKDDRLARKILLADDSVTAQNMGRKILADAGYDVVTVNNGSAALKRIAEIKPDLIVLDVYMPGYSGVEVCQRLKDSAETAHIPVLLTVGKLEPFKPEEARRVKADGHIVKPFEASELLTAITRLEDRIVPQQAEGGRKTEADGETGWKSRLRFPSKKKKEEFEPEPEEIAEASFRDFRKGKVKPGASGTLAAKATTRPEPEVVPDIPRDITPEELDALSELAAKLDGPIAVPDNIRPLGEKPTTEKPMAAAVASIAPEVAAVTTEGAVAETEISAARAAEVTEKAKQEASRETETPAPPVVEPAALVVESPALSADLAAQAKDEVQIPVDDVEPPAELAAAAPVPAAAEVHQPETQYPEAEPPAVPAAVVAIAVDTAALAEAPAPVDGNDEPMFAAAPIAPEQAVAEPAVAEPAVKIKEESEAAIEARPIEAVAESGAGESVAANDLEAKPEQSQAAESQVEQLPAENAAEPVAVALTAPDTMEAEEPAPSDEELAEALRLLTPATGNAYGSMIPSHGTLVAAGQLLAVEAARNAGTAPRWIAELVALSPEELAISLEAEMFRTFEAVPAAEPAGEIQATRITGVSAIAAAVESRLAEADLAASAKAEQEAERCLSERFASVDNSETAPGEVAVIASETPDEVRAASSAVDAVVEPEKADADKAEAGQNDSAAEVAEEAPVEEVAAVTFADAVGNSENDAEPAAEKNQDSSSDSESEESMGTDAISKAGKSNWRQIRTTPAGIAGDAVEAAKQSEQVAEEAPKAMAAAAAAEGSASTSITDASTIASIVDSVMADLRPKIVEEIAKKLAGK
jgi:CheY-like chemotaxis protein